MAAALLAVATNHNRTGGTHGSLTALDTAGTAATARPGRWRRKYLDSAAAAGTYLRRPDAVGA